MRLICTIIMIAIIEYKYMKQLIKQRYQRENYDNLEYN